jgi:L-iditol 2-dehydrogenase
VKAFRLASQQIGQMDLEEYELDDRPPAGGILVKAGYTIISAGTEVANYLGKTTERPPERTTPYYPGYSFAGEVVAVGEGVDRFAPGDRIAGPLPHASMAIEARPERLARLTHVPDGVTDREAALTQLGCIALNGVRTAGIQLGESVVVIGAGLVGLLAARLSQLNGGHPLAILDLIEERRIGASRFGITNVFDPADPATDEAIAALAPEGADVVIEATGSPHAFVPALKLAARAGRVVLLGSTRGFVEGFSPYDDAHRKGLTIVGAHVSTTPTSTTAHDKWSEPANRRVLLSLMQERVLDVNPLITHVVSPWEAGAAFAGLAEDPEQYLGVAIDWSRL